MPDTYFDPLRQRWSPVQRVVYSEAIYNRQSNVNFMQDLNRRLSDLERSGG